MVSQLTVHSTSNKANLPSEQAKHPKRHLKELYLVMLVISGFATNGLFTSFSLMACYVHTVVWNHVLNYEYVANSLAEMLQTRYPL